MAARRVHLLALIAAGLAACVQDDGRRWSPTRLIEVSEEQEREIGFEFDRWAQQNLELIDDPVVMGFINDFGQAMVRSVEPQPFVYRFRVIRDSRLNAFAVPGGYIYFHSETLLAASSIDEVAGVLAHEIAHVKARHYKRGVEKNAIPSLLVQLASVGATVATGHPAPMIVGMGVNVAFQLKYSREFEEEADRFGAVFMTRTGYDVRGMARFFERIAAEEDESGADGTKVAPYLYTHPDVKERMLGVLAAAEQLRPITEPDPVLAMEFRSAQERLAALLASGRTLMREGQRPGERERADPALRLAEERVARGDRDAALAVLAGAERGSPGDPRLPFRRGELLEEAGRLDEAIAAYRRAVELDPTTGLVLYKLGRAYAETGDRHRAAYYLEQSLLRLGETSAVRKRADREIERVTFPVAVEAGLAEDFGAGPLGPRDDFTPSGSVVWWARIGSRHLDQRERIRVRWIDPAGQVAGEQDVEALRKPFVAARFALADAAPGRWTVEARIEGVFVDRRAFVVRPPGAPAQPSR
jgi:predicted Zn-dependent protease